MKKNVGSSISIVFGAVLFIVFLSVLSHFGLTQNPIISFFLNYKVLFPLIFVILLIRSIFELHKNLAAASKNRPMVDSDDFARIDGKVRPFGQNPGDSMFSDLNDYDTKYYKFGKLNIVDPWDIPDEKPPWEL